MPWYYAVAERDHEIQDPTSPEKIRQLGSLLRLGPESRVLDVACGKAGPALVLASEFGCTILGVERASEFVAAGRERIADAGLSDRIEIVEGDASAFPLQDEAWDAALCLGASFVYHDLEGTLAALTPAVRRGGGQQTDQQRSYAEHRAILRHAHMQRRIVRDDQRRRQQRRDAQSPIATPNLGLSPTQAEVLEWLAENPDDPEAPGIRERHERARDGYLALQRRLLGWAIFAALKP